MFHENAIPSKVSYIFKCNNLSDNFLFGDDIKVPPREVEKIQQKFKGRGRKTYQTSSVADMSEDNYPTQSDMSSSQYTRSQKSK
jgi:hypothetical protein